MCLDAKFSLTGEKEAECTEGVDVFKYLRRLLDGLGDDLSEVLRNIRKARQVWERLRNLIRREGSESAVLEKIYHSVVQVVLFFGADTWVILAPTSQRLDGVHLGFLQQVTKSKANRLRDRLWRKAAAKKVPQGAGAQPLRTYLDRRQATVAEWVVLRPIFGVHARKTGYEGRGKLRMRWWRQEEEEKQIKFTVEELSAAAKVRRWREYSRRGESKSKGGSEGGSTDSEG